MFRIATVCTGNICRSPMAERALRAALEQEGVHDVAVDSAGISDEEHGGPIDPRAARVLTREGLDASGHRAQQVDASWFADHDLLLAMDLPHARALRRMAPTPQDAEKVRMYRSFDPQAADLPEDQQGIDDPWYGGPEGFETTWRLVTAAVPGILAEARRHPTDQEPA